MPVCKRLFFARKKNILAFWKILKICLFLVNGSGFAAGGWLAEKDAKIVL